MELKPCPHCGGLAELTFKCPHCGADMRERKEA